MAQWGSTSDKNLELKGLATPSITIPAGNQFEAIGIVANKAEFIGSWDPDSCGESLGAECNVNWNDPAGYCVEVDFWVEGSEDSEIDCAHMGALGYRETDYKTQLTAPDPNVATDYKVYAQATATGSGNKSAVLEDTITVSPDADVPADDPDDNGNNGSSDITNWIVNNPLQAGGLVLIGTVATRTAVESAFGGDN